MSVFHSCRIQGPYSGPFPGTALDLADRQLYALEVEVAEVMTRDLLLHLQSLPVKALLSSKEAVHKV